MFMFLAAANAVLGIIALASLSATHTQGSASISTDVPPLTSTNNKMRSCTVSTRPVEWIITPSENLSTSTRYSSTLRGAKYTSSSEVNFTDEEIDSSLQYWQLAPSLIPSDLEIGYTTIDEDGADVTITTQDLLISARAPSSASSSSPSTSIDSISLFIDPLIPTDTTSTSSSLTSTSSSSKSESTVTAHTTSTKFTTVVTTTVRVTASASASPSSSSTNNPFTTIPSAISSSQSTIETLPLPPSTSSSSSLSSGSLPTSLSTAITASSSAVTPNVISSSPQAGTSNPTTPSSVSATTIASLTNALPTSSSTMAPMNKLSTSSAIGIGAGVGASSLLIISILVAWFIIRRRRKRHAEAREKRNSGTTMVMDTDPTRYEKPEAVASQPSSASAQDAAELDTSGVYEMDAGNNAWPGDGYGRTSPRLYRPIQEYGREDARGRSYVG